jgi:hypothetical protein
VSLILEALRKLERDKPAPDRGVVVMTSVGLGDSRPQRGPWLWLTLGLAAGVAAASVFLQWERPSTVSPAPGREPMTASTTTLPPAPVARAAAPLPVSTATPLPRRMHPPAALSVETPVPELEAAPIATPPPAHATRAATPSPAPALVLQAITVQDGHPVALINDRVLREGDEIDGVRIRRIGETEVEIERDGQHEVLRF